MASPSTEGFERKRDRINQEPVDFSQKNQLVPKLEQVCGKMALAKI